MHFLTHLKAFSLELIYDICFAQEINCVFEKSHQNGVCLHMYVVLFGDTKSENLDSGMHVL